MQRQNAQITIHIEPIRAIPRPGYILQIRIVQLAQHAPRIANHARSILAHDTLLRRQVLCPQRERKQRHARIRPGVEFR